MHPTKLQATEYLEQPFFAVALSLVVGLATRRAAKRGEARRGDAPSPGRILVGPGQGPGTRCGLFSNLIVVGPRFPLLLPLSPSRNAPWSLLASLTLCCVHLGPVPSSRLQTPRLVSSCFVSFRFVSSRLAVPLSPSSWKPGRRYAVVFTRVGTRVRTYTYALVAAQVRP